MNYPKATMLVAFAVVLASASCNRAEPVREADVETADTSVDEALQRSEEAAELEKRTVDLEQRLAEMQAEVKEEGRAPTAGLREEVREDVARARDAVANLKTTTAENWWERHEKATEQALQDIEADVQRFAKGKAAPEPTVKAEPVGTTAGFEERRTGFVANMRARVDAMEERLKDVKAEGARETELQDTRARIDKLQEDLDRLRTVSAGDWWDVSSERVEEYIARVEESIGRLNNDAR